MVIAKRISCILTLLLATGLISVASADIYRCQAELGGKAVFTDNRYACHLAAATSLSVKPQVLRIERKLLAEIPDLSQRDPAADFPDGGRKYCAPVAVSNSLSTLLPKADLPEMMGGLANTRQFEQQVEIARTLGGADYMATGDRGTNPRQLLQGVDLYLEQQNLPSYHSGQLEYRGQRSVPRKYNPTLDKQAELPWLISGIQQDKHIWVNIGWYKTQANGKQKRIGGHWVTLVGYEKLGSLKDSKGEYLFINDPATRGIEGQEQVVVKAARLNGRHGFQLINPASKPKKADMAWVEGAIQLAL